jgi:hypothetical protein
VSDGTCLLRYRLTCSLACDALGFPWTFRRNTMIGRTRCTSRCLRQTTVSTSS